MQQTPLFLPLSIDLYRLRFRDVIVPLAMTNTLSHAAYLASPDEQNLLTIHASKVSRAVRRVSPSPVSREKLQATHS